MSSAVVYAYHNVGVRCLRALIASGVDVRLVVTHEDDPDENLWFGSVKRTAEDHAIPVIAPADPNTPEVEATLRATAPDFLFSFYYRRMLRAPSLAVPARGAFNMHGSLLPKYRGRAPINWAILHGERETGATLHVMTPKPDDGPIVDQVAVPILPDDTARDVFDKVVVAAELCLVRALPGLLAGTTVPVPQDPTAARYFGGRGPEDGRIDWSLGARRIHDLVRAVTHPYPGAFADTPLGRLQIWRTRVLDDGGPAAGPARLIARDGRLVILTADGGSLLVSDADLDGRPLTIERAIALAGGRLNLTE